MGMSYTQLYDLARKERSHQELQELPPLFYGEVEAMLTELSVQARGSLLHEAEQARTQLLNARKLCKQLYEQREEKIMRLAQSKCKTGSSLLDTSRLLEQEIQFYERLLALLSAQRKAILQAHADETLGVPLATSITPAQPSNSHARPEETVSVSAAIDAQRAHGVPHEGAIEESAGSTIVHSRTIRVIKPVAAFVGAEMETYGPYAENELVALPEKVAQILVRRGNASLEEE